MYDRIDLINKKANQRTWKKLVNLDINAKLKKITKYKI